VLYPHELLPDERRELLRIARATLHEYADSGRIPPGKPHRPSLVAPAAVTVRIYLDGDVIASAGDDDTPHPLYRGIQEWIVAAAAALTRPLDDSLLEEVRIEISVRSHLAGGSGPAAQTFCEPARAT
jgi:hypothetical protein